MWVRRVSGGVGGVAYSPDGGTLYTADRGGAVTAWDLTTHEVKHRFWMDWIDRANVEALFVVGDGRYLVADTRYRSLAWDLHEAKRLPDLAEPCGWNAIQPAPTGRAVRYLSPGHHTVRSYDVSTRKSSPLVRRVRGLDVLRAFAFTPDDRTVLLLDRSNGLAVVTLRTGHAVVHKHRPPPWPHAVHFSPDGRSILWVYDHRVQVWDYPDLTVRLEKVPCGYPHAGVALHPTLPAFAALNPEGVLTLFSLETGEAIRSLDFAIGRWVQCVAFSPDGLTCAAGGSNSQFAVFDVDL
jgi:WD40 repeat protein